jgi:hypothetical protein
MLCCSWHCRWHQHHTTQQQRAPPTDQAGPDMCSKELPYIGDPTAHNYVLAQNSGSGTQWGNATTNLAICHPFCPLTQHQ